MKGVVASVLLVNKPLRWTSFDVVKKIRSSLKKKYNINKLKVGHCGTLDPLASGLLIICTGSKTKTIKDYESLTKTYQGVMKLGCITRSFDRETEEENFQNFRNINMEQVQSVFLGFLGLQDQNPPIFSALKVDGERLYKKARRGEKNIPVKSRKITIYELRLLKFNLPFVSFEVKCSKGTYIRTLVHDIGIRLNCGAYLYELTRTHIGSYDLKDAIEISDIIAEI